MIRVIFSVNKIVNECLLNGSRKCTTEAGSQESDQILLNALKIDSVFNQDSTLIKYTAVKVTCICIRTSYYIFCMREMSSMGLLTRT